MVALSEIFGLETCALGNLGKHSRTDFLSIMEGKDVIGPFRPGQNLVRPCGRPLQGPTDSQESGKHLTCTG